ncbi:MAG: thioesterase II family protein [Hyphomicrobiales bacterium]
MAVRRFRRTGDAGASEPRLRLFCFPHAGAGAASFRTWPDHLPDGIEVACPCLPGRDARAGETPLAQMAPLVRDLADQVANLLDRSYALYGHSLGAFIAFDLAHELVKRGAPEPARLIVSGQRGPRLPYGRTPIFRLPDDEFLAGVRRRHNAIPEAILADPAMRTYLTRLLRADFTLVEAYRHPDVSPLSCTITVYGGVDDPMVRREQLEAWTQETAGDCAIRMVPGAHLFPQSHQAELLALISRDLEV